MNRSIDLTEDEETKPIEKWRFDRLLERAERFSALVKRGADDECWPWLGAPVNGYGSFVIAGKSTRIRAHRGAWSLFHNRPAPAGLCICHSCDNRACCNPAHLWVGTYLDNTYDMIAKGRTRYVPRKRDADLCRGTDHPFSKLTREQVISIYGDPRKIEVIAAELGVHRSVVSRVRRGVTYAEIYREVRALADTAQAQGTGQ